MTPAEHPALELRGLRAGHDGVPVVHDLDLRVDAGEVVALLGPNGAGKTTTLLTVSGLLAPLGGEIRLAGTSLATGGRWSRPVGPTGRARRGLAHVPEDRGLFSGLTGREHLRLATPRDPEGLPAVTGVLDRLPHLAAVVDRRAGLMSGGEQQMLAIARALVASPRVLMVDELSLGLAPIVASELLATVREIATDAGLGVLLVEQHVHAALRVADRAVVLVHGHVAMAGTAAELRSDRSEIARRYLGPAPG